MALCYHKEVFVSGIVVALLVFGIITIFKDVIISGIEKFISLINFEYKKKK